LGTLLGQGGVSVGVLVQFQTGVPWVGQSSWGSSQRRSHWQGLHVQALRPP
jgi:hypothetical protein